MVDLPELWNAASPEEKQDLLRLMFEEVYVDAESRRITGVRPKPAFLPLLGFCGALEENEEVSRMVREPVSCVPWSDPEGIRTPDLHRDRVAC